MESEKKIPDRNKDPRSTKCKLQRQELKPYTYTKNFSFYYTIIISVNVSYKLHISA